jgi:hypothetical protein
MSRPDQQWSGRWWLPGREADSVSGDVMLSRDEFVLSLSGMLDVPRPGTSGGGVITSFFRPVQQSVILGESRSGERLTLLDCDGVVPEIPASMRESAWHPSAALIGGHLERRADAVFTGVRTQFDYLLDWTGGSLSRSYGLEKERTRFTRVEFDLQSEVIGRTNVDEAGVELRVPRQWRIDNRKAEIELWPTFQVDFPTPIGWQEVMRTWVRPLRDLVSFATLRGTRIEDVFLAARTLEDTWLRLVVRWLDLGRGARTERQLIPHDMLFTARGFPQGFEEGLPRWFELHRQHSSVMDLMFGVDYAPFMYDEERFLALAQAAEIFHRTFIGGSRLPTEEHRRRVDAVVSLLHEEDLAQWARPILQEGNHLRLAERLHGLVGQLDELGHEISGDDEELFVRRIKDTRNYLTHRDRRRDTVLEGAERYWHGQAVLWVLRALLLQELGFSGDETARTLRDTPRFQSFTRSIRNQSEDD